MNNRKQALLEIAEALACPIDMATLFKVQGPVSFVRLEHLWAEIVKRHAVDQEAVYLHEFLLIENVPDEELRQMQINVRTWRDRARQEFLQQTRRFTHLRYATRDEYEKHLPPPGARPAPEWIENRSRHGPSLFYQEVPPDFMLSVFLHGIFFHFEVEPFSEEGAGDYLWEQLLYNDQCRVAFRSINEIGATDGVPTCFLAFDLNTSIPILHAYPVSEQEAHTIRGACRFINTRELIDLGR
jgi:hypothetical protein